MYCTNCLTNHSQNQIKANNGQRFGDKYLYSPI